MKFQRTSKGATIELDEDECDEMRSMMHLCAEWEYDLSRLILVGLDEMLTEEGQ